MANKHEFAELKGKTVEAVVVHEDVDGAHQLEARFEDKTGFVINLESRLLIESAELRDWTEGEGTLIKKFI